MEMKIDPSYVKAQREQRAWSQEHLAEVSGLGLRTIQRIETTGSASYESARALAAVFEVTVADLRAEEPTGPVLRLNVPLRPLLGVLAAVVMGGALLVATTSFADQVLMDVSIERKSAIPGSTGVEVNEWKTQFVVDEGTPMPLSVAGVRLTIVPKLLPVPNEGKILVEMQIFEQRDGGEVLVGSPRLVIADGQKAEVEIGQNEARSFRFSITPRRHSRLL